ncbi:MAG: hypothetical protein QW279_14075, partial [Candidatus Jordarchaeaceae archaeon]
MKKVIFNFVVLLLFQCCFASILYSYAPKVDFQVLDMNYKGVCSNSKAVVAYDNDFTNITVSTDKGEIWIQKTLLSIFNTLTKLKVCNDIFYGIADSSIVVISSDGLNWSSYYSPVSNKFVDISADSNYIYLLSSERNKLFILDKNIRLVDSFKTSFYITEIFSFKNKTYLGTKNGKVIILASGLGSESQIVDLNGFEISISNFFSDGGRIYFLGSGTLYSLDSSNSNTEIVLANVPENFTVKDGEIYSLRNETIYLYGKLAKWVGFYQYNKNLNEFIKLNNDNPDRFIEPFESFLPSSKLNFTFIDEDNIILVAENKTILISNNRGKKWRLRSFLVPGSGTVEPFVLKNYMWKTFGRMILRSTDYGITWLPQKADSLFIISLSSNNGIKYVFFDTSGKGFIVNNLEFYYQDSSRNFEILYSNDFGENYKRGQNKRLMWLGIGSNRQSEMVKFKEQYILKRVNWSNLSDNRPPFSHLEFFDTNFTNTGFRLFNDTVLYKIFFLNNPDTLYGYFLKGTFSDTVSYYLKDIKTWIGFTTDGLKWEKLFDTDINEFYYTVNTTPKGLVGFRERNYDSTLDVVKIFHVDIKKRTTTFLLDKTVTSEMRDFYNQGLVFMYAVLNDKVFYSDFLDSIIYVCDLSSTNFPNWERTQIFDPLLNYFGYGVLYYFFSPLDSVFYFFYATPRKVYSYLFKVNVQDTSISNVENNGTTLEKLFVQTLPPFPQPASSFVKAKIYIEG